MPLLDHLNPPLRPNPSLAQLPRELGPRPHGPAFLTRVSCPQAYYAVPLVDRDGPIEIDVATLQDQEAPGTLSGGVEQPTWVAPAPALAVAVELANVNGVEVQVFADDGDPRLAAAVELLPAAASPRSSLSFLLRHALRSRRSFARNSQPMSAPRSLKRST